MSLCERYDGSIKQDLAVAKANRNRTKHSVRTSIWKYTPTGYQPKSILTAPSSHATCMVTSRKRLASRATYTLLSTPIVQMRCWR
ncbi:hypothetical protein AAMO2058_001214000 [Amorphochlora amoebiformis]